jgi:hypothetical protein
VISVTLESAAIEARSSLCTPTPSEGTIGDLIDVLSGSLQRSNPDPIDVQQHQKPGNDDDMQQQPNKSDGVVGIALVRRRGLRQRWQHAQ